MKNRVIFCRSPSNVNIRLGEHSLNSNSGNELDIDTNTIIVHEDYAPVLIDNDISLLLMNEISFNDYYTPVCRPTKATGDEYAGLDGYISGWGTTSEGGKLLLVILFIALSDYL